MAFRSVLFLIALVAGPVRDGRGGDHNLRFAPSDRLLPADSALYGDAQVLAASVECLTPVISQQEKLHIRVRLHWQGFTIDAINPFLDPELEAVSQLAVFDEKDQYLGNLMGWRPSQYLEPIRTMRSHPVQVRWSKGAGVTGRTVVTRARVQPESGERVALMEGRYKMQLIVYDRVFSDRSLLKGIPIVACRSDPVVFDIGGDSQKGPFAQGKNKENRQRIEFRFVGSPLRFEIENIGDTVEELYDPWLVSYERYGEAGAYRFEWTQADGNVLINSVLPRGIPNRGSWFKMPPGGFAGRDVYFKPTGRSLTDGHATLTAVVLEGALAKNAFPDREAPWDFVHCTEVLSRSKQAEYEAPDWKAR